MCAYALFRLIKIAFDSISHGLEIKIAKSQVKLVKELVDSGIPVDKAQSIVLASVQRLNNANKESDKLLSNFTNLIDK